MQDSLGDRMKSNYENITRNYLPKRTNTIIRLDGRAFHTLTRNCHKPFDSFFISAMQSTLYYLCKEISNVKFGYTQSDEISLLLTDYDTLLTQQWFGGNIQKIVSISASLASVHFSEFYEKSVTFDSRAFTIAEKEEVVNYFIWRQKDWNRNSLNMLAQNYFSHSQLQNKNSADKHEMLHDIAVNWNDLPLHQKNGSSCLKINGEWILDDSPTFTGNRNYIKQVFPSIE